MTFRQTKIVATLGPATDPREVTEKIIRRGVNVVRINFSHGDSERQRERVELVRECARRQKRAVSILADLQGPKIRIAKFKDGPVFLNKGDRFVLNAELDAEQGTLERVGVTYRNLPKDVKLGDVLIVDDGNIVLRVTEVLDPLVTTEVLVGGELSNSKGINRQGGGLTASSLTAKDHKDIRTAGEIDVDYLAVSFVRNEVDVQIARELLRATGCQGGIISKVERAEAVENMEEIITASDGIMIARGDLAVEIGDARLPGVQKRLIRMARERNCLTITATQMMQSMIESSQPTRAEVLDVANAVLDGSDAVMLSQESAVGRHPAKVVAALDRICRGSELTDYEVKLDAQPRGRYVNVEEAIATAAMHSAKSFNIVAIVALTESGSTAKWLSRMLSGIPIFAVSSHSATHRRVALFRGVHPIDLELSEDSELRVERQVINELLRRENVAKGDRVVITKGDLMGVEGGTNTMKIITV